MSSTEPSWLTYLFMIAGPILAVIFSIGYSTWYQNRSQKLEAQRHLFRTLMAYRMVSLPPVELVNSLNLIDVTFANKPRVLELWHNYYNLISQPQVNWTLAHYTYLDLMTEIAKVLGYKTLTQTDIAKFYSPQGYLDQFQLNDQTQREWLRVLENTARFVVDKRDDEKMPS